MAQGGIFLTRAAIDAPFGTQRAAFRSGALGQSIAEHPKFKQGFFKRAFSFNGLGADILTMDPQTQAALKTCSDKCEASYGVSSGHPDLIGLTACFASCNAKYPPTVTPPPALARTLPAIPGLMVPAQPAPAQPSPYEPLVPPGPAPSNLKWWLLGGAALAAVGVGVYAYKKRKG